MKRKFPKLLSVVLALSVLLSCVLAGTFSTASAESDAEANIKAAAQAYVDTAGNKATQDGLLAAVQAVAADAAVDSFAISHMLPGAVDNDPNADTQFRMDGKAGAVVAVVTAGGEKFTTVSTIPYAKETIRISGVAIAGQSEGFTYDGSNNITNYSGTADKLVIPADFTGTVTGASNFEKQFKVVVIKNSVAIPAQAFIGCTELIAVDIVGVPLNSATNQFRSCTNLKYAKLNAFARKNGTNGAALIGQQAFQDCTNLQNVGIIVNAHGWGSGMLDWNCFANTPALPVLYWDNARGGTVYESSSGIGFTGAKYNNATTVTSALLAAELQAMAGAVEYTEGMTGDEVIAAIKASPWLAVYDSKPDYTLAWNGEFDADSTDGKVGGDLLLTVGEETFPLSFERWFNDSSDMAAVKAAAQAYVDAEGNKATQNGMLAAVQAAVPGATVNSFAISHMLPGAVDNDPNADTRLNIPGKAGAVAATFAIGDVEASAVFTIPYVKEVIAISGVAVAGTSEGFTYDASNNITNYSGTADKLVIPADFTGTVIGAAGYTSKFKVVVIKNTVAIATQAFIGCTDLVAADVGSATINANAQTFRGCTSLKYFNLNALGGNGGAQGILIQGEAFRFCSNLQNMGIIQNAHGWGSTRLEWASFAGTTALPVLYLKWNNGAGINLHNCDYAGTVYTSGTTVTPALLAAELQAMAGAVEFTDGMTGDDVIAAIKASKWLGVYLNVPSYTLAWNGEFDADDTDGKVGGDLLLTVGSDTFDLSYEYAKQTVNPEELEDDISAAFTKHVETVKNAITKTSLSEAFSKELAKYLMTGYSISVEEFYAYKAIGGAVRDNGDVLVPGHDGYAAALIKIVDDSGAKLLPVIKKIPAPMETYTFASVSQESDFDISDDGKILYGYEGNAELVIIPDGVEVMDEAWSMFAEVDKVKALILPDSLTALPLNMVYGMSNLEVCSMGDNIYGSYPDVFTKAGSLRYVRLSENLEGIGANMFSMTPSLVQLYIPQKVKTFSSSAFYKSALKDVTIAYDAEYLADGVFEWPSRNPAVFVSASQGALFTAEKAAEISTWLQSMGALNQARTITVLNPELDITTKTSFAGDDSGGWNINIVRAPLDSTTMKHIQDSYASYYAVVKQNVQTLNMTITEAAARAQIMADGLRLNNESTANSVAKRIKNAYFGDTLTGDVTWVEEFSLTEANEDVTGAATGVLRITDSNGVSFDVTIDAVVYDEIVLEPDDDDFESDFDDDDYESDFDDGYGDGENDEEDEESSPVTGDATVLPIALLTVLAIGVAVFTRKKKAE